MKIRIVAGVRYAEDALVNGVEENDSTPVMPLLSKSDESYFEWKWDITVDSETGKIEGWPEGTTAKTWYKVCDCCKVYVEGRKPYYDYVPDFMSIYSHGYGDYVYVEIKADGCIKNWCSEKAVGWVEEHMEHA